MQQKELAIKILGIFAGMIALAALGFVFYSRPAEISIGRDEAYTSPFPGDTLAAYPPLGVMIENELLARPFQTGLSEAAVVYEAPTEGNITRFLAIFPFKNSADGGNYGGKLGPIRSARSYFIDWLHEYAGVYVHVGGHSDALARLAKEKVFNADQFFFEKYFRRENVGKTLLEHTMFSDGTQLKKLIEDNFWTWQEVDHPFLQKSPAQNNFNAYPKATNLTINFGLSTYNVSYDYDSSTGRYLRSQAGAPHIDQGNLEHLAPAAVVVQKVQVQSNGDAAGTISMKTLGSGEAFIFIGGRVIAGTWKKETPESPTRFFDENNSEIVLGVRPVWVEIVPTENIFSYK